MENTSCSLLYLLQDALVRPLGNPHFCGSERAELWKSLSAFIYGPFHCFEIKLTSSVSRYSLPF